MSKLYLQVHMKGNVFVDSAIESDGSEVMFRVPGCYYPLYATVVSNPPQFSPGTVVQAKVMVTGEEFSLRLYRTKNSRWKSFDTSSISYSDESVIVETVLLEGE